VVLLTPGGSAAEAADDVLPYVERRDTSWVGEYKVDGRRAEVLVWFDDYWDTCVINLDSAAVAQLALALARISAHTFLRWACCSSARSPHPGMTREALRHLTAPKLPSTATPLCSASRTGTGLKRCFAGAKRAT
jgi:hypothetical protein